MSKGKGNGMAGGIPSTDFLIMRQMLEAQHKEQMDAVIGMMNTRFGQIQNAFTNSQRNHMMLDQKVNLALQTIELIKGGLEEKGILTQADMDKILEAQLDQQMKAREILSDEAISNDEKLTRLQAEASLTEKEAKSIFNMYESARAEAERAGTSFVGADGESDSGGAEEQGEDGPGDQGGSETAQPDNANPHIRIIEP